MKESFQVISVIIISAVCSLAACDSYEYHFVNEKKTCNDARKYCRDKYTDLATISNEEEMNNLTNTLKGKTTGYVVIGLRRGKPKDWRSCMQQETGKTYFKWCPNRPKLNQVNDACVLMTTEGCWTDQDCVKSNPFVCYNASERYIFISDQKSWCDARRYCREHHTDLASVRNQTENQQILNVIQGAKVSSVWIGLSRTSWTWSDGSDFCFRNWKQGQPGVINNCAAVSMKDAKTQGQWIDWTCFYILPFVCYKKVVTDISGTLTPQPNPGTNSSDDEDLPDEEAKLILIKENLTWTDALSYCREHHVDLVSAHTAEIQYWVEGVAQDATTEHVWLGLVHTCVLGFWFWVGGETVCYQNWAPGNGTGHEDCSHGDRTGAVQSGGEQQWVSLTPDQKLNFICSSVDI